MNEDNLANHFAFSNIRSLGEAFGRLIDPAFSIAAVAVVMYIVYGAFRYVRSAGDKEAVAAARKMITHAIIGFILLIFMFLIIKFIPEVLFPNFPGYRIIQ